MQFVNYSVFAIAMNCELLCTVELFGAFRTVRIEHNLFSKLWVSNGYTYICNMRSGKLFDDGNELGARFAFTEYIRDTVPSWAKFTNIDFARKGQPSKIFVYVLDPRGLYIVHSIKYVTNTSRGLDDKTI